jgi:F-type H+-transporting ATPase subunit a
LFVYKDNRYYIKGTENWSSELVNWGITGHVISIAIITIALLILFFIINYKIKRADPLQKPKGILLLTEMLVTMIDDFTVGMLGKKLKSISPYIGFLAVYLLLANIMGLFGFTPPTSSLSVTFTFGITSFILIRYYGVKFKGREHFTGLFKPILLSPINIIGELALPISLSVRIFGNILSGLVIMTLIYGGLGLISPFLELATGLTFVVPLLHIYFDLFSGVIQTLVFILLSTVFLSNATE